MSHALLSAWEKTLRLRRDDCAATLAADGTTCTFGELDARATAWLATHAPADPRALRGRAVVFAAPNGPGWLALFLALQRSGAIAVPLDAAEPSPSQQRAAESLRAGFWWDGTRLIPLSNAKRYRDPHLALIKLTSGTTGQPRPLVFTAAQMLADAKQVTSTMGIRARDLNYALIPFGHSYGLGNLSIPLIAQGIPVVCGGIPLPHAIAADFARWQPTVFPGVPAIFRALAASDVPPASLASLRLPISAGAPLAPEVARDFATRFDRRLHSFYGSSETGGISFDRTGTATLEGGVGRPLNGVRVSMLKGQRLRINSAAVFTYANSRHAGAHGSWTPPDRAELDARGQLTLLGRRGATVKIAGRRVNLAEVTTRLRRLSGVADAWVTIGPGTEPTLGAVLATTRPVLDLRTELQADTAAWKVPKKWATLPEFPLTARGKTDTRSLASLLKW